MLLLPLKTPAVVRSEQQLGKLGPTPLMPSAQPAMTTKNVCA